MNIAYLILAHEDPAQLARLVNALYTPNSYFFIHVDRKVASHLSPILCLLSPM